MKKVYLINGPNLNMLGVREPDIYGTTTLSRMVKIIRGFARKKSVKLKSFQSNHEGRIIDRIQSLAGGRFEGLIINPGAYTHYSYAIRDAIKASGVRTVEVHLSDIEKREEFRRVSVIKEVCEAQIKGLGIEGYVRALEILLDS
jgi:3-dehydroquinate dehydratase-2